MKLYLDDRREAPEGWVRAQSVNEAIKMIIAADVWEDVSLDNDLGMWEWDGGEGYKLVDWMIEHDKWPLNKPKVHSWNVVRRAQMLADIDRFVRY